MNGLAFKPSWRQLGLGCLLAVTVLVSASCAKGDDEEADFQPLAAAASDLGGAVHYFIKKNPELAKQLGDAERVQRAAAHDPNLLAPYKNYSVMASPSGVILVCDKEKSRGLVEDAPCSDKVDRLTWREKNAPCMFTLDLAAVCPLPQK